jgi:flavodoxin
MQFGSFFANDFYSQRKNNILRCEIMRKIFKIILAIFAALIIIVGAFAAVVFLDIAAYTATGSQTLTPIGTGNSGKALVAFDPGLSGTAKGVADKVASDLQAQGFTVTLAGIKSSAVANITGYSVVVVGGPIYAGSPTASVKDFLSNLPAGQASQGDGPYVLTSVGVFGSGQGPTSPEDIAMIKNAVPALSNNGTLSNAVVVKIGQTEDLNTRAQDFVNQLTQ